MLATPISGIANQYKWCYKGNRLKFGFCWFLAPSFGDQSMQMHVYHYPLSDSGAKTGL